MTYKRSGGPVPLHRIRIYEEACKHLSCPEKLWVVVILSKYKDFFVKSKTELGRSKLGEHKIDTRDHPPVKDRPRRIPFHRHQLVEEKLKEMLEVGVIQASESLWSACPVLANKPDGTVR